MLVNEEVGKLPGVGPSLKAKLHELGISVCRHAVAAVYLQARSSSSLSRSEAASRSCRRHEIVSVSRALDGASHRDACCASILSVTTAPVASIPRAVSFALSTSVA